MRSETVERCLACEADGDQGDIVRHALLLSPLCIAPTEVWTVRLWEHEISESPRSDEQRIERSLANGIR
jgi:hypothetical protein